MINLRAFEQHDTEQLISCLNNLKVTKYITTAIVQPYLRDDALAWIAHGEKNVYVRAIELNGQCIGCISADVGSFEYTHSAELGYWVDPTYWNRGIATEAVGIFSDWLFTNSSFGVHFQLKNQGESPPDVASSRRVKLSSCKTCVK